MLSLPPRALLAALFSGGLMNWLAIVLTAFLSAALTCSVIAWWLQYQVRPRFM